MPLFALSNAGVQLAGWDFDHSLTTAVLVALVVGKPFGMVLFTFDVVQLRLAALPGQLSWKLLAAGSLLTGIGFTMALPVDAKQRSAQRDEADAMFQMAPVTGHRPDYGAHKPDQRLQPCPAASTREQRPL